MARRRDVGARAGASPAATSVTVTPQRSRYQIVSPSTALVGGRTVDRPTILAIPGGPGFGSVSLRPGIDELGAGYGLVVADLADALAFDDYVVEIERLRTTLDCSTVVVLGHAFGAILAVEYGLRHPEATRAIVAVNPLRVLTKDGPDGEAQRRVIERTDPSAYDDYARFYPMVGRALAGNTSLWPAINADPMWSRMLRTQFSVPPPEDWFARVAAERDVRPYFAFKGAVFGDPLHPLASYDLAERAARLTRPLAIVASSSDENYVAPFERHAKLLHDRVRGSELAVLEGAGHFPFVENPASFARATTGALTALGLPPVFPTAGTVAGEPR